jgi:pimeloyl-ACP methyl ester carboxylesterase
MNEQFAHYATTVPGNGEYSAPIPLHFVHERSDDEAATPLLLIHGWASTHLEWSRIIKPLAQQGSKAFHVVAVDLPGFGFSPAARQPGLGAREMGRAFDALMRQLGHDKYGLVTTDLGWLIGMWMVEDVRDSISATLRISSWFPRASQILHGKLKMRLPRKKISSWQPQVSGSRIMHRTLR